MGTETPLKSRTVVVPTGRRSHTAATQTDPLTISHHCPPGDSQADENRQREPSTFAGLLGNSSFGLG